jgi:hypothetical protein
MRISARIIGVVVAVSAASIASSQGQSQAPETPMPPADYAALAKLPDWRGVWQPDWSTIASRNRADPAFTPAAAKAAAAFKAQQAEGKNLQTEAANCVPSGMPQIMRMPYPIEFIYSPDRVTIVIETYSQVRRVYTDGRPLPEDPDPAFNGSSVGRWEGGTLVIDTIGLNPATNIVPGIHPTEQTRIRERISLENPKLMVIETTVTDPTIFAKPLVMTQKYIREPTWQIREYVCQENNKDAADEFGRPSMKLD